MKSLVTFLLLFVVATLTYGQTNISGTISSDSVLGLSGSPYIVTGNLTIASGSSLTIAPSVQVKFDSGTSLIVQGRLIVDGHSADSMVLFTSNAGSPAPGDWNGVELQNTADLNSAVNFCVVEYGGGGQNGANIFYKTGAPVIAITNSTVRYSSGQGVNARASSPRIANSTFTHNNGYGIYSDLLSNFIAESCVVINNTAGGIRIPINSSPVIEHCMIDTNGTGIFIDNAATPVIRFNNIRNNSVGIRFGNVGAYQPTIIYDTITNNSQWGFLNVSTTTTVVAIRNYWGTESGPFSQNSNPTGTGNAVSSRVNFSPWLTLTPPAPVTQITSTISSNTTWSNGVYMISGNITVNSGITLTLSPGAIVKFNPLARLTVSGRIVADGTSDSLIVFTSYRDDSYGGNSTGDTTAHNPNPGDWDMLYLATGQNNSSSLNNCVFKYGGYYSSGNLYIESSTPTSVSHIYCTNSSTYGMRLWSCNSTISNSTISGNGNIGILAQGTSHFSVINSIVTGNNGTGIHADYGGSNSTLVLLDSSNVSFNNGNGVYSWQSSGPQTFSHNHIESNAGVGFWCYNINDTVKISDNDILNNTAEGIGTSKAIISNNVIQGNRYPIALIGRMGTTYSGNTITSNQYNNAIALRMNREDLSDTLKADFPAGMTSGTYVIIENSTGIGVGSGATLVIEPGLIIKMDAGMYFRVDGTLIANGTPQKPIVFTSHRDASYGGKTNLVSDINLPLPNDWRYVRIRPASGASASVINNCVFKYGGQDNVANLWIEGGSTLTNGITNTVSRKSSTMGIRVDDVLVTFNNVTLDSNGSYGMYINGNGPADVTIRNSTIQDNGATGLYTDNNSTYREVSNCIIRRNNGHGIGVNNGTLPHVYNGNTISYNNGHGIYDNSRPISATNLQFIGNLIEHNNGEGILSSAARFIDNTIRYNYYPIGVWGHLGNIYVDNNGVDGNVITDNVYNNAIALANGGGLSDTMKNVFPSAITSSTYVVIDDITVSNGTTLVIQPNVNIKFQITSGTYHQFNVSGTLNAQGTPNSPIVFTSWKDNSVGGKTSAATDTLPVSPGDWYYTAFRNGSGGSIIRHCQFRYGGRDGYQAMYFEQNLGGMVFSNNRVTKSSTGGIVVYNTSLVIDSTTIDSCGYNGIRLYGYNGYNVTLRNSNISYNGQYGVWAQSPSNFSVITKSNLSNNGYTGLYVENNSIPLSIIGNTFNNNHDHGLYVIARNDAVDTLVEIAGNSLLNNGLAGLVCSRAIVSEDSIIGNRYPIGAVGQLSLTGKSTENGTLYSSNYISGNRFNDVVMTEGAIYGILGGTFPQGMTSHVIAVRGDANVPNGSRLDIVPGTIIKFPVEYSYGRFQADGVLKSEGTNQKKIVFTSWNDDTYGGDSNADSNATVPGPGNWDMVYLYNSGSNTSHLLNTIVRYGGKNGDGNVYFSSTSASIDSSFISFSSYYGIFEYNSSSPITACDIHDNVYDGIWLQGNSNPPIHLNNISSNGRSGLYNYYTGNVVDAANNYWGAQSGPYVDQGSDQNLTGTGNRLLMYGGSITYRPFFTTRSGILIGDVSSNGTISAYDGAVVLQSVVGSVILSPSQITAADVTGDGSVSAFDASYILRYVVGLITGFPAGGKLSTQTLSAAFDVRIEHAATQGQFVAIIRAKNPLNVYANQIQFTFNNQLITPLSVKTTTLTNDMTMMSHFEDGKANIALAGTAPISQSGDIVEMTFAYSAQDDPTVTNPLQVKKFIVNEIDMTSEVTVVHTSKELPASYALMQNYPNPFNPTTVIHYALPENSQVKLTVFNALGEIVEQLVDGIQEAGEYSVELNGSRLASGVYFYRIDAASNKQKSFSTVRKMLLVK